jgi:hypothetical protein
VVGDINQRTHGTEFYGTSSNFVLLNQLFAFARKTHPSRHVGSNGHKTTSYLFPTSLGDNVEFPTPGGNSLSTSDEHDARPELAALSQDRVSIINLLSNEEVLSPPSRLKTPPRLTSDGQFNPDDPVVTSSRAVNGSMASTVRESPVVVPQLSTQDERTANLATQPCSSTGPSNQNTTASSTQASKRRLEQVYIHTFLDNLHHLHPMLDPVLFEERCKRYVWGTHTTNERHKCSRHFFALYNMVVAVGALVAGTNVIKNLGRDMQLFIAQLGDSEKSKPVTSSQTISRIYFRKAKNLLGDASEVCSLESAQSLLLMVNSNYGASGDIR